MKLRLILLLSILLFSCRAIKESGYYVVRKVDSPYIKFYRTTWMWGENTPVRGTYLYPDCHCSPGDSVYIKILQ